MSLTAGAKLGPYEILDRIGAGGMGEVYRARDSRLGRDIAIKISAEQFSDRFEREARAIAALNHSNICTLFDVGPNYLVMELIDGPTLADRIGQGPIPLEEALAIARQIADGLDAAHARNIVHRDLKPGNVKIRPDGSVKVLDFGLAKAGAAETAVTHDSPTLMQSPTLVGVILGTAAYMAPEQARGKPVDKRADIWAFGVVLYEMLTGERLFEGEDLTETLASVVKSEPNLTHVPQRVRRLLARCLQKDPAKRLRDIGDVWELLDAESPSAPAAAIAARPRSHAGLIWSLVSGTLALALAVLAFLHFRETPEPHPLLRLSVDLGPAAVAGNRGTVAISPDGTRIVLIVQPQLGISQLATRTLDQPNATILSGTELAADPFFSPNGQWIGFFAGGKLKKVAAQGGAPVTLCDAPNSRRGSWAEDGAIVFSSNSILMRVSDAGGMPQSVAKTSDLGDLTGAYYPSVLPRSGAILFERTAAGSFNAEDAEISVFSPGTRQVKVLHHGGYAANYMPTSTSSGHLVYIHEGTLFGVPFNPARLELRGAPAPLLEDVAADPTNGSGQYAFSQTGTFVYLSGKRAGRTYPIELLDSSGKTTSLVAQPGAYDAPRFSPDGKRLAYQVTGGKGTDVWVYDLAAHTSTQLTFTAPGNREIAWAPDSKHLVFGSSASQDGAAALWWIRADGAGQPVKLLERKIGPRPQSISRDGRLMFAQNTDGLPDLFVLPLDLSDPDHPRPGKVEPFLTTPGIVEVDGAYSPDGGWVAYASSEAGEEGVYVRSSNPNAGGKRRISAGAKFPVWSHDNRLFFLGGDDRIMVTTYNVSGDAFNFATPHVWSDRQILRRGTRQNFDLAPDGARVAIFPRLEVEQSQSLHATFLLNYFDEVRRRIKP